MAHGRYATYACSPDVGISTCSLNCFAEYLIEREYIVYQSVADRGWASSA